MNGKELSLKAFLAKTITVLSPEEMVIMNQFVQNILGMFEEFYNEFIPEKTKKAIKLQRQVLYVLREEDFRTAFFLATNNMAALNKKCILPLSYTCKEEKLILLNDPSLYWQRCSKEQKKSFIKMYLSTLEAQDSLRILGLLTEISSNTLHLYEGKSIPLVLSECAVRYYQEELLNEIGIDSIVFPLDIERMKFYKDLLENPPFSKAVQDLFFGNPIDAKLETDLIFICLQAKDLLFPDTKEN